MNQQNSTGDWKSAPKNQCGNRSSKKFLSRKMSCADGLHRPET
jgi:hypothetical protein